ncbi:uncharacterized protein BDZ99DRAFT_460466 [Mytilinidion resinicola]|uniref:Uncharacterized protein n=1 Tax=Mytilinidion resinicola TaxID=574789 RepID=A0A6A6YXM5_9PEZI|nr:uncharacterized protein BDZ99DRAFT_460466 [Mytilinidion resinicola]KAF2813173.1 hypothetical protein BDZ99DRAFT_460466 [Mytilinidion resinicola]
MSAPSRAWRLRLNRHWPFVCDPITVSMTYVFIVARLSRTEFKRRHLRGGPESVVRVG